MTGQRVEHVGFPGRQGEIWLPKFANEHESFWHAARALGLTADPEPDEMRVWHMVAWDNRPGALEVRYVEELTFLSSESPTPEPTDREKLITEIEHAMWHALHAAEDDKWDGACVIPGDGLIDGHLSLRPAAEAAMKIINDRMLEVIKKSWFGVTP